MKSNNQGNKSIFTILRLKKWIILLGIICLLFILYKIFAKSSGSPVDMTSYTVKNDNLVIDVLESGSVETSNSLVIKSEVEGQTTIITIVPEGTILTPKDVTDKKVLVELDSSDLRQRADQDEIEVQSAQANYTDAKESYNIQVKQNESNLKAAEQKVTFALMDLKKYLGDRLTTDVMQNKIRVLDAINDPNLGGEGLQKKRKLLNEIDLTKEETTRARVKLDWTKRLYEKGYVTGDDVQADELALKRQEVNFEQAQTSLDLYLRYESQKDIEKLHTDYDESIKEYERAQSKARAEISKAEARLKSGEATLKSKSERYKKLLDQINKCKIIATIPGMITYAGSNQPWRDDQIKEGSKVFERQEIIKIPNTTAVTVETRIHESVINRVKEGQKSIITIDAIPDKSFEGSVKKVGLLPDTENRWLNPNLKVYKTSVTLGGNNPQLKPGMSAQVRIIMNEIKNVLTVPIQAVSTKDGKRVCYLMSSSEPVIKEVETGEYNDKFMEIKSGLKEGDRVVLNISSFAGKGEDQKDKAKSGEVGKKETPQNGAQPIISKVGNSNQPKSNSK